MPFGCCTGCAGKIVYIYVQGTDAGSYGPGDFSYPTPVAGYAKGDVYSADSGSLITNLSSNFDWRTEGAYLDTVERWCTGVGSSFYGPATPDLKYETWARFYGPMNGIWTYHADHVYGTTLATPDSDGSMELNSDEYLEFKPAVPSGYGDTDDVYNVYVIWPDKVIGDLSFPIADDATDRFQNVFVTASDLFIGT